MSVPNEGTTLDRRTLNRTLLLRQHLLRGSTSTAATMIEHLVGMQAQVPRDPYLGLRARIDGFDPSELERLIAERAAVRMTLMRTTLHLVTAADAWRLRSAMQPVCERGFAGSPFARSLLGVDVAAVRAAGIAALDRGPLTAAELGRALEARWPGHDRGALAFAVRYLEPLVQVPPRGLWHRSGAARLAPLAEWIGAPESGTRAPEVGGDAARDADDAILRYLRAFGPATVADISAWSWLTGVRHRVARLRPSLRAYRDESGRELLDVADGVFEDGQAVAPVQFLGEYDNLFLSHADRTRVTGDLRWGRDFVRKGAVFVDGFLVGAWRVRPEPTTKVLRIEAGGSLSERDRRDVTDEAERLGAFLSPDDRWSVELVEV